VHAFLTVRKLKSGSYDDWRRAWEPDEWPQGSKKNLGNRKGRVCGLFVGGASRTRTGDLPRAQLRRALVLHAICREAERRGV
jgi:hypothetical protein